MSKNQRQAIENHLAHVSADRRDGPTLEDVPSIIRDYHSPDEQVRVAALRRSCPCHVPWEIYLELRKPALRLRRDPSPTVRALANHLEQDARELESMEAATRRWEERDEEQALQFKPSSKRAKRDVRRRPRSS